MFVCVRDKTNIWIQTVPQIRANYSQSMFMYRSICVSMYGNMHSGDWERQQSSYIFLHGKCSDSIIDYLWYDMIMINK